MQCNGRTRLTKRGDFGFLTVQCERRVGVKVWYDASGAIHAGCASHVAELVRRFPESDPPEPVWLHEDSTLVNFPEPVVIGSKWLVFDDLDAAKWSADREGSWTA